MRKIGLALLALLAMSGGESKKIKKETEKEKPIRRSGNEPGDEITIRTIGSFPVMQTEAKLYIPDRLMEGEENAKEIVIFLHGDNTKPESLDEITERHNLSAQISKASQGARRGHSVWIAPYSKGKCDDFNEVFSSPRKAMDFIYAIVDELIDQGVRFDGQGPVPIVMAGQSRARIPIRKALESIGEFGLLRHRIGEVFLFDALYDSVEAFSKFAMREKTRFWMAYGTHTLKRTTEMFKILATKTTKAFYSNLELDKTQTIPYQLPLTENYIAGASLEQCYNGLTEQERNMAIGFVSSSVEHKYTARNYLAALMG